MNNVSITNVYFLYAAIPLILLLCVSFFVVIKRKKLNFHNVASLVLHVLIVSSLALALSGINYTAPSSDNEVIVLCDVSASDAHSLSKVQKYVDDVSEKLGKDGSLAVVAFAKGQETVTPFGAELKSVAENSVDRSATNIEEALYYAQGLFRNGANKRIVLISDGNETDGSALKAVKKLENENIRIDTIFIDEEKNYQDVLIDQVVYNDSAFLGKEEKAKVYLRANYETDVKVSLFQNKSVVSEKEVRSQNGVCSVEFALDTASYGVKEYRVEIEAAFNTESKNNVNYFSQYVSKTARTLIVGGTSEDISATLPLYSQDETETVLATDCPCAMEFLGGFDTIVLSGVDLKTIPSAETFVEHLQTVVADYGKSLAVYGGRDLYGGTALFNNYNKMLPVNYDVSKTSSAVILVVDASKSMLADDRIGMAKLGAISCLDLLGDDDFISVIAFSGTVQVVVPLMRVVDKDWVIDKINSITLDRDTMMTAGLRAAYEQIKGLSFDSKQVLLISDGIPGDSNQKPYVENLLLENVTTSVINIASDEGEVFLKGLATAGNGNYYHIDSPTDLPEIMLNEVNNDIGDTKVEQTCAPIVKAETDLSLVGVTALPEVGGLNYSVSKYAATTVLTCKFTDYTETTREAPLYTYWDYGSGKVSLLNFNLSEDWANGWLLNSEVKRFLANSTRVQLPNVRREQAYFVDFIDMGAQSRLEVTPDNPSKTGKMSASVLFPNGEKVELELRFVNGVYYSEFGKGEPGSYTVELEYQTEENTFTNRYYVSFSYSSEYDTFALGDGYLLSQCALNGGEMTDDVSTLGLDRMETGTREIAFTAAFLILAIALFVVDVAVRKLKWSDFVYLFRGNGNRP